MAEGNNAQVDDKQTPPAPEPGTPEYDKAMAEKARAGNVTFNGEKIGGEGNGNGENKSDEGDKPVRPDFIPEKFWNAEKGEVNLEAWAKSYHELETKQSQQKQDDNKDDGKKDGEGNTDDAAAAAALREKANAEFAANGKLSDETYAEYEKRGVTREQIDRYIEGEKAMVALRQREAFDVAGGQETYNAMIAWARTALTQTEIEAYDNIVLGSNDATARVNAIKNLLSRYEADNGREGTLQGGTNSQSVGEHFRSKAEMVKAMSDPRYKKDAAYRQEVATKTANALRAGINLGVG